MARVGVLSDAAVKIHCPEMFPLPNDQYRLFHPTTIDHHTMPGIKPEKRFKDYTDFARFPDNDFRNFGNIMAVNNRETASLRAILNYRNQIGSKNFPSNVPQEALDEFERIRQGERTQGGGITVMNLSTLGGQPSGIAPIPSAPASAPATSSGAGTSTQLSQALTGVSIGGPSQIVLSVTPKERGASKRAFRDTVGVAANKRFTPNAGSYLGAMNSDIQNHVLAHFSGSFNTRTSRITEDEAHHYLLSSGFADTVDKRTALQSMLSESKKTRLNEMIGQMGSSVFFRRVPEAADPDKLAQIEAQLEDADL